MRHARAEVIERTICEFERLEGLIAGLTDGDWARPVSRPEAKDPWTVKDAVAHIAYWKADTARSIRRQRRPPEERKLNLGETNHLVYVRWRDLSPKEVQAWHRQVQSDLLSALRETPDVWFSGRERQPWWPFDLDGHSEKHRVQDIERALSSQAIDSRPRS
jgi:hypothetical protein